MTNLARRNQEQFKGKISFDESKNIHDHAPTQGENTTANVLRDYPYSWTVLIDNCSALTSMYGRATTYAGSAPHPIPSSTAVVFSPPAAGQSKKSLAVG